MAYRIGTPQQRYNAFQFTLPLCLLAWRHLLKIALFQQFRDTARFGNQATSRGLRWVRRKDKFNRKLIEQVLYG